MITNFSFEAEVHIMTDSDGIAIALDTRIYLYELFRRIFSHEPSLDMLELFIGDHAREALDLVLTDESCDESGQTDLYRTYLSLVADLRSAIDKDAEITLERIGSEYVYLLIGPHKLPAPPWESIYVSKESLLFQENTLEVRRKYLKYRVLPATYPKEPDDHIALELDFMAHLAKSTMESFEKWNYEEIIQLLHDQKTFLEEHLLVWINEFAQRIQHSKTHYFYPTVAALTSGILKADMKNVLDIMANLTEREKNIFLN